MERVERAVDREKTSGATIVVDFYSGVAGLVASRVFSRLGMNAVVMEGFANANAVGGRREDGAARGNQAGRSRRAHRGSAFGAVVGPEAEHVQFVDDKGEFVPPDVMLACLIDRLQPRKVVLPINLSPPVRQASRGQRRHGRVEPHGPGQRRHKGRRLPGRPRRSGRRALHLPDLPPSPRLLHNPRPRARGVPGQPLSKTRAEVRRALWQRRSREGWNARGRPRGA